MYQSLRSSGALSYEKVEQMFETHQDKWSEAIFNEDAQFKYLDPLIKDGDAQYLSMLQGSKAEQRKWWLWNRFRYMDSKYDAGDAVKATNTITIRAYKNTESSSATIPSITVTPYASIYASVKYGSYLVSQRAMRNEATTLTNPLDAVNDTEIYIYSADQISDVGDLSGFYVGYANFSYATKLTSLKLGDASSSYSNPNLGKDAGSTLTLGNNTLLRYLDVRNCPNLSQAVDLSGCTGLEEAYFEGTAITGVSLPDGGALKHLHLPSTVASLIVKNQPLLDDIVLADASNISTLVLVNVSTAFDSYALFSQMQANGRARLEGIDWTIDDANDIIDLLKSMRGIDANDQTTEFAQLSGKIHFGKIRKWQLANLQYRYPYVEITYGTLYNNKLTTYNTGSNTATSGSWNLVGVKGIPTNTPTITRSNAVNNVAQFYIYYPDMNGSIQTAITGNGAADAYVGIGSDGDTGVVELANSGYASTSTSGRIFYVYVPDDLVDEYKEATNWSTVADNIKPLSEFDINKWSDWDGTEVS